jgi:hypothetical protein
LYFKVVKYADECAKIKSPNVAGTQKNVSFKKCPETIIKIESTFNVLNFLEIISLLGDVIEDG